VILAIGAKSAVCMCASRKLNQEEAIGELNSINYIGSVANLKKAPFLYMQIGDNHLHIMSTGEEHELSFTSHQLAPAANSSVNLSIGSTNFSPLSGINWIIAQMGWGKTYLLESIARAFTATPQVIVRFGEPNAASEYFGDGLDVNGVLYTTVQTPFLLLVDMFTRIYGPEDVTVYYDSFRYFIHAKGLGGTGERGVDNLLPTQCTALGNVFMAHKRLAYAAINPKISLESEDEILRYQRLVNDYAGAVDTLIVGGRARGQATLYSRSLGFREGVHGMITTETGHKSANSERLSDKEHDSLSVFVSSDRTMEPQTFEALLRLNTMARKSMTWDNQGNSPY
jgi:hypothetical protein